MTPHLRGHVRGYVDRTLPAAMLRVFDQHLVACELCRAAAEQERRIVVALRADTRVPQSLHAMLMGVAAPGQEVPDVPEAPARVRLHLPSSPFRDPQPASRQPVPTITPGAPALHRSPVRAAVLASLAATASVAAAWGLTVVPMQVGARSLTPSAKAPVDATSFGPSLFSQAISARTTTASRPGGPRESWLTSPDRTVQGPVGEPSAPASVWAATKVLGLPEIPAPVRVSVVSSAQSRP
ncbi:MAG: hypothetical protein L0H79_21840 [Intrasporangium sp.]|uniref:anti-sigma factor family protein n=1 Tax=Intrasporangium sp. TaxID=1925024 RepID=UPI002647B993|nr:hypothetical protein [Intrasporangium sp.]MDN5798369.1 hypothetical protein [Intrasporangium sp.]